MHHINRDSLTLLHRLGSAVDRAEDQYPKGRGLESNLSQSFKTSVGHWQCRLSSLLFKGMVTPKIFCRMTDQAELTKLENSSNSAVIPLQTQPYIAGIHQSLLNYKLVYNGGFSDFELPSLVRDSTYVAQNL